MKIDDYPICFVCGGNGTIIDQGNIDCKQCNGYGYLNVENINIPIVKKVIKPIFILRLSNNAIHEIVIAEEKTKHLADYYVLIINTNHDELTFKVLYEKGFNEVKLDELKEIVKKGLK